MGANNWQLQWLNTNAQRSYPLADHGSGRDESETIKIPDSFIVAFYLPVHAGLDVEPDKFYLQKLSIFPTGYNIAIGYDDGASSPPPVAAVNIAKSTHQENTSYAIPGVGSFDDTLGQIAIGRLDEIDLLPPGEYTFVPGATPLEPDVIRPMIRGISSITVIDGQDSSPRLYGDVELVAGENMRLTVASVAGQTPRITFSAISGDGLNEDCICEEETDSSPILFINGIPPGPDGNFRLVGDDCIELTPITNGIQSSDKCSSPCCGCEELDALTRQLDRFADGALTLRNFVDNLGNKVSQLDSIVLSSSLYDTNCENCP